MELCAELIEAFLEGLEFRNIECGRNQIHKV